MKLRSTAVMSTSALTWRSSCPVLSVRIAQSCFRTGIYTIPEISMAGKTEAQLTDAKILTRLESPSTRSWQKVRSWGWHWTTENTFRCRNADKCRGVYVIGENAAEIVHIGQAVLSLGATIEYFRDTVFDYPTLAEADKLAALDGLNKLDWKGGKYNEDQNTTFGSLDSRREAYNHWNCFRA